jgi:hypothetical protein
MENVLPKYIKPLKGINEPTVNVDFWEKAIEAFDNKEYRKSAIAVVNYINPKLLADLNIEDDIDIVQMQGSAEIHLKITKNQFIVKAPFLKITNQTNKVALLRKVAEANFSPLTLAQINLHKDELWFDYKMPITLCQPNKIYDLLKEVCVYADDYDNMFIDNYKASFYKEPKNKELTSEEANQVWLQIDAIFNDYKNYSAFFKEKRWDDYQWDITVISLLKIANMSYVHGKLRTDLQEYISNLFNGNLDFTFRKEKGTNFMKELIAIPKDEIMSNMYHAEQFISLRWRSSEQIIKDWATDRLEMVKKYQKNKNNFNLSYYLQFNFLKLIYDFNIEENYVNAIDNVLEEVSGLEPNKAVKKLVDTFYAFHQGKVNQINSKKNKKGFFSGLFN